MTLPALLPADLFNVEHRLDGGPNGDGLGWGTFEWDPAPNVPTFGALTWGTVEHTAETAGIPAYTGGLHPHLTYLPAPQRRWIQHVRLDRRCGTLMGTSTVEAGRKVPTNRAKVHQIEIAAYSAWWIAAQSVTRVAVRDLDLDDLTELARWHRWHHDTFGSPLTWWPYDGAAPADPMPHAEWVPLDGRRQWGACDHGTASDASTHWDAGGLNRARVMELAGGIILEPKEPEVLYPRKGDTDPRVVELQATLNLATGTALTTDGVYGAKTAQAVEALQTAAGITAEGKTYAGPLTWAALSAWPVTPDDDGLPTFLAKITPRRILNR